MGVRRSSILSGATRDWLLERMTRDFTLRGLVAELAGRGVKVDYVQVWVQVWRFAHVEGLSFQKKRAARRTAPSRDRPASGAVCQSAFKRDPLSACKRDSLRRAA